LNRLSSQLTILHVTAPAPVGGLESVVTMLARGHTAMGHRVCVAALVDPAVGAYPFLDDLEAEGVETERIVIPARAYGKERDAVRALCDELKPDVVHTHGYRSDVVDSAVARAAGVPVVSTVHGFTGGGLRNRIYEWIQERAFRDFDAVVAVSEPIVERLARRGVARSRIHLIPNAFDGAASVVERVAARERLGLPKDEFTVGWVGRLSAEKGPDVFIDAIQHLAQPLPAAAVVGGGPDEQLLRERAERLGVAERLRWLGVVPGAGALIGAFDIFVLSSRTEGLPIVLLEAAAAGVPIVATRVGGVPSMFPDGEVALVAPDDPHALAAAIDAVRSDPAAAHSRAAAARRRLEGDFAPRPWLERHEALYRSLPERRSGVGRGKGRGDDIHRGGKVTEKADDMRTGGTEARGW
jgi:glycosyltransferase involved in cell wall biosynthesis